MRATDREVAPPLAYRLCLLFGRPFGLRWVPDNHLGTVYRMESYNRLGGPGFFWIKPGIETVKSQVSLNPDFISAEVPIRTHDAVELTLRMGLAYVFDPRSLPREKALVFVKWPQHVLRAIVNDFVSNALLFIMARYTAEQACRVEVLDIIERDLLADLTNRLQVLAIRTTFVQVLGIAAPPKLQETFTAAANRAAYTRDMFQFHPFQISEAQRREYLEALKEMPGDILYPTLPGAEVTPALWQISQAPPRPVMRGESKPILSPSPPEPLPEPPSGEGSSQPSGISRKHHAEQ